MATTGIGVANPLITFRTVFLFSILHLLSMLCRPGELSWGRTFQFVSSVPPRLKNAIQNRSSANQANHIAGFAGRLFRLRPT
jgi:hypothetical protein